MFTAQGYIDRAAYTAVVGADPPADDAVGLLSGSPNVLALLDLYDGRDVLVTPTGPTVTVDKASEDAIAALLLAHTQVVTSDGMPEVVPPPVYGAVY